MLCFYCCCCWKKKRYLVKSSTFEIPFFKLGNRKHHCICKLSWKDCMARAELKKTKEENLRKAVLRPNQITIGGHQCHSKTTCTTQAHFCMFLFLQLLFSRFQISSSVFFSRKPLEFSFCLNFSKLLGHVQKWSHPSWLVHLFPSSCITAHRGRTKCDPPPKMLFKWGEGSQQKSWFSS